VCQVNSHTRLASPAAVSSCCCCCKVTTQQLRWRAVQPKATDRFVLERRAALAHRRTNSDWSERYSSVGSGTAGVQVQSGAPAHSLTLTTGLGKADVGKYIAYVFPTPVSRWVYSTRLTLAPHLPNYRRGHIILLGTEDIVDVSACPSLS